MLFNDAYQTILAKSEGVFRDKGSKFIAMLEDMDGLKVEYLYTS
jgi:hypothetical protein